MPDSPLLTADHDAIRVITVNRPDKLNALNAATLDALHAAFDAAADDAAVRAVVLTGAGPKAFVAGADIAEMSGLTPVQGRDFSQAGQRMMRRGEKMPQPGIAGVKSVALGGRQGREVFCHPRTRAHTPTVPQRRRNLGPATCRGGTQP